MSLNAVTGAIKKHKSFLITSHINPEADALGSQLAARELLKALGKRSYCVDNDPVPAHYKFLPGIEGIKNNLKKGADYDAVIVLDCPTAARTGRVKKLFKKTAPVLNIDHHVSNEMFGDINWVKPHSSSTGEMIYALYKKLGVAISKKTALYIYVAILTDTGSFNYSNTSGVTHDIVSDLLGRGLYPRDISSSIYENKTLSSVRLLGKIVSGIKTAQNGRISYMVCTQGMFKKTGSVPSDTENFVNFAKSIKSVDIAIFIREDLRKRNLFNVSFRSKGNVDVNKLAALFGGGGHQNASGCVVRGSLADVKRKVLRKAKEALQD